MICAFMAVSTLMTIRLTVGSSARSVSCHVCAQFALYCLVLQVFTVAKMQSMRISTLAVVSARLS